MIDFHTHPVMIKELLDADEELESNIHNVFGFHFPALPLDNFLLEMDEAGIDQAVLLPIDCTTSHNCVIVSNDQIAMLVNKTPRFIGFASIDSQVTNAPLQLMRAIRDLGLQGLKLDPSLQKFSPDDEKIAYPVYEMCAQLGIPILMHSGMSWTPSGLARYAQPLLLEPVIQEFPTVNFILAHFAWPWVQEAVMLAVKYKNVYLDTSIMYSGTPRDTLHQVLVKQIGLSVIERSIREQVLFGSNYPRIDMRRSVRGIQALDLRNDVEEMILSKNAHRLLGLRREK